MTRRYHCRLAVSARKVLTARLRQPESEFKPWRLCLYHEHLTYIHVTHHCLPKFGRMCRPMGCYQQAHNYLSTGGFGVEMLPKSELCVSHLLTTSCVGIHPGRVEPASPIELAMSRTEVRQARLPCASSLETFTQFFLHHAWPKTRGPESGSRSDSIVVAHVFSWPPVPLRHVRGGVGRRGSLISSPSERLAA